MSLQVSYKKQVMFFLMLFLIVLIIVEFGVRIYDFFNPYCAFLDKDAFEETSWYTLRWICLDSNALEYEENPILRTIPDQSFNTIHINNFGFRGSDIFKEKPIDTYRIFVVGGSTTFGFGSTSDDATIPGYLQEEFKKNKNFENVEIINAGMGQATSFHEKYLIENILNGFSPNMIIIYDGSNDVNYREINPTLNKGIVDTEKNPFKFNSYPFYRTPFIIWQNTFRHHDVGPTETSTTLSLDLEKNTVSFWKQNIDDVCNSQKKDNIKTIFFVQPILDSGNKILSNDELEYTKKYLDKVTLENRLMDNFSHELDDLKNSCYLVADLRNVFDDVKKPLFYDNVHLNDLGNQIVAKEIYEKILPIVLEDISTPFNLTIFDSTKI